MRSSKPVIKVLPPGPLSRELVNEECKLLFPPPRLYSIAADSVSNCLIKDLDGNVYIDFTSGGLECPLGHSVEISDEKIGVEPHRLISVDLDRATGVTPVRLARRLTQLLKLKSESYKLFLGVTLEDCVEAAARILEEYSGKRVFITASHGYYGETSLGATLSGKANRRKNDFSATVIHAPAPYCYRCVFKLDPSECHVECVKFIETFLFENVVSFEEIAGAFIEPIMVRGGCIIPPEKYFQRMNDLVKDYRITLIANEADLGLGRTGSWIASKRFGLKFHGVIIKSSLAGCLPLSALIGESTILNSVKHWTYPRRFYLSSCLAALQVIEYMVKHRIPENANKQGLLLKKRLKELAEEYDRVGDVRGLGLLVGVEIVKDKLRKVNDPSGALKLIRECARRGLMLSVCGRSTILFAPPLSVDAETVEESVTIFEGALGEVFD
ncbi:MAG: aminotransferase class III-fold pyridoxal phosphate-dependent enzyme [Candidatus Bathyarchaeia archaeon]